MPISSRRGILASSIAPVAAVAVMGAPAAHAVKKPDIKISGGVTQPVFSYQDAAREYVRVQSSVDADHDGKKDLIRVDIVRPKESGPAFRVPVIMDESPYYDNLGRGNEWEKKTYDANRLTAASQQPSAPTEPSRSGGRLPPWPPATSYGGVCQQRAVARLLGERELRGRGMAELTITWIKSSYSSSSGNCVQAGVGTGPAELGEIARIERVKTYLRDLDDVAACDRRLAGLRAELTAREAPPERR